MPDTSFGYNHQSSVEKQDIILRLSKPGALRNVGQVSVSVMMTVTSRVPKHLPKFTIGTKIAILNLSINVAWRRSVRN
jgi:hypothetical protein